MSTCDYILRVGAAPLRDVNAWQAPPIPSERVVEQAPPNNMCDVSPPLFVDE